MIPNFTQFIKNTYNEVNDYKKTHGAESFLKDGKITDPKIINQLGIQADKDAKKREQEKKQKEANILNSYNKNIKDLDLALSNKYINEEQKNKLLSVKNGLTKTITGLGLNKQDVKVEPKQEVTDTDPNNTGLDLDMSGVEDKAKTDTSITTSTTNPATTTTTTTNNSEASNAINKSGLGNGVVGQMAAKGFTAGESTLESRRKIAASLGLSSYEGTSEQNNKIAEYIKNNDVATVRAILKGTNNGTTENTTTEDKKEDTTVIPTESFLTDDITGGGSSTIDPSKSEDASTVNDKSDTTEEDSTVFQREFDKTIKEYSDSLDKNASEKAAIQDEYAKKIKAIEEDTNLDARARANKRTELLNEIKGNLDSNVADRRQELENNTQRTKNVASRQANIGAALAGQSGATLSASQISGLQNNILADWDSNVGNAELAQIKANSELDQVLRDTGLSIFNNKATIDLFKDGLDVKENAPLVNALTAALAGDIKAKEDINTFLKTAYETEATEQQERVLQDERIKAQSEQYVSYSPNEKVDFLYDKAKGIDGFGLIQDSIRQLILDYPNLGYAEMIGKIEKEAKHANDANILANTFSQKEYTKMSPSEKKFYDYVLDTGYDVKGRMGNKSVEETNAVKDDLIKLQKDYELKQSAEQTNTDKKDEAKNTTEVIKEANVPTEPKGFKGFKTEKNYNDYVASYKLLQEKLTQAKASKNKDDITKLMDYAKRLEAARIKNTI